MEFGRIKYDIFFKRVFGKKPHITRAFLNAVLKENLKSPIQEVSFSETEFIIKGKNRLVNESKHNVIDIFCKDQEGNRILIEIQKGTNKLAIPRFLDYHCRNYSSQFKSGDDYSNVVACYSVCWLFDLKPPHNDIVETVSLCSNKEDSDWTFDWTIKALYPRNLPKWKELVKILRTQHQNTLAEWLVLDVIPDPRRAEQIRNAIHTDEVVEAFGDLDLSGYTERQLREIEYRTEYGDLIEQDVQKREKEILEQAEKEKKAALEKAEQQRLEALEKAEKEKEQIAKTMLQFADIEIVSKTTGLSIEQIKKIVDGI
ncbi:MAG: Rpn family recombination-promoting nuclease/putative transposase [Chitinophagales bacterium]